MSFSPALKRDTLAVTLREDVALSRVRGECRKGQRVFDVDLLQCFCEAQEAGIAVRFSNTPLVTLEEVVDALVEGEFQYFCLHVLSFVTLFTDRETTIARKPASCQQEKALPLK